MTEKIKIDGVFQICSSRLKIPDTFINVLEVMTDSVNFYEE